MRICINEDLLYTSTINEFYVYELWALLQRGFYGGISGYFAYQEQIGHHPSWSTIQKKYWKDKGYSTTPLGNEVSIGAKGYVGFGFTLDFTNGFKFGIRVGLDG